VNEVTEDRQLQQLHVQLVLQLDQQSTQIRRLRWWVLCHALLLLALTIVVFEWRPSATP
jgi:hypothetical protein